MSYSNDNLGATAEWLCEELKTIRQFRRQGILPDNKSAREEMLETMLGAANELRARQGMRPLDPDDED